MRNGNKQFYNWLFIDITDLRNRAVGMVYVYVAFSPSVTKKGCRGAAESLVLKVEVMVPKIDVVVLFFLKGAPDPPAALIIN